MARLSKNTFARLFPAMQDPDASFGQEEAPNLASFADEGGYQGSDPDREAPSSPTTRAPFQMPPGAYTPPPIETLGGSSPVQPETDPMGIDTLVRIGQAAKTGRDFAKDEKLSRSLQPIDASAVAGGPPDWTFPIWDPKTKEYTGAKRGPGVTTEGTDSFGRKYTDPADQPPPAMPAEAKPKRPKSALEVAREKFEAVRGKQIVDEDKSKKGRLLEGIHNALAGISAVYKANPNAHWSAMVAGGAARGVAGGFVDRTLNERDQHEKDLAIAKRDYDLANEVATDEEKLNQAESKRKVDEFEAMTKREKLIYDQLDENKKNVLSQLRDIDEIDPDSKDPRIQEFIKQAAAAGVVVQKKSKNSKFSFDITPDGQLIIGDTTTGSYKKGQGNYSKPPAFTPNELPDEMFGIKDDKTIEDEATAAFAKDFPNRRLRPERANQLREMKGDDGNQPYLNPDGSLNEAKAMTDGVLDEGAYENGPDNYEQKRAGHRNRVRASQAALKTEVANFRTAISNQRPLGDAQEQPISKVKDLFLRIMQLPPKQRAPKLKAFYENLPNIRITG